MSIVVKNNSGRAAKSSVKIVEVPTSRQTTLIEKTTSKRKGRRKGNRRRGIGGFMPPVLSQYIRALEDPFENGPVKMGFGTMVPTSLASAYTRVTATSSSDGYLWIGLWPSVGNGNNYFVVGGNTTAGAAGTNVTFGAVNTGTIGTLAGECRVVSTGIRAFPSVAATAAPGQCGFGAFPTISMSSLNGMSNAAFFASPYTNIGPANLGATALGRPIDPDSFIFTLASRNGPASITDSGLSQFSFPYIVFAGLPASTNVFIEVVVNIEYLPSNGSGSVVGSTEPQGETLSDWFSSVESMWKTAGSMLSYNSLSGVNSALASSTYKTNVPDAVTRFQGGLNTAANLASGAARFLNVANRATMHYRNTLGSYTGGPRPFPTVFG